MTITENGKDEEVDAFTFRIPNKEISKIYLETFFNDVFELTPEYLSELTRELPKALAERDSVTVAQLICDILTSIPSNRHPPKEDFASSEQPNTGNKPTNTERYYHGILHASFLTAGFEVHSEGSGAIGRDDIALYLNDRFRAVMELKYCHAYNTENEGDAVKADCEGKEAERKAKEMSAALDRAEKQMRDKDYAGPYRAAGCTVTCLGVAIRNRNQVEVRFFDY
jgi:hypothetical protein